MRLLYTFSSTAIKEFSISRKRKLYSIKLTTNLIVCANATYLIGIILKKFVSSGRIMHNWKSLTKLNSNLQKLLLKGVLVWCSDTGANRVKIYMQKTEDDGSKWLEILQNALSERWNCRSHSQVLTKLSKIATGLRKAKNDGLSKCHFNKNPGRI